MFSYNSYIITIVSQFECSNLKGEILSIIPELLTMFRYETGQPILNPSCKAGMIVDVVTFPAPSAWETEKGLSIFGPEYIVRLACRPILF
ncbi:hypothetical protein [Brevibacillus choshinensis]|uniref:S-methyl thiohydantoin desulfurase domain-containing protein n=1 Tax=Brevibacillus choshinensis TaxID=54911 RepID=UPI00399CFDE9